jgi:hypothetical protein
MRVFVKEFTYASIYAATVETRWKMLKSKESNGKFLYPYLTSGEIEAFDRKWHELNPEIQMWWDQLVYLYRKQGYLEEPVFHARCDFLDGEDLNKLANFQPQAGGSALVHLATFKLLEKITFGKWGPGSGLMQQGHDALVVEVPADHDGPQVVEKDETGKVVGTKWCADPNCRCTAAQTARYLEECMTINGREYGLPLMFKGEAVIGKTWHDV